MSTSFAALLCAALKEEAISCLAGRQGEPWDAPRLLPAHQQQAGAGEGQM